MSRISELHQNQDLLHHGRVKYVVFFFSLLSVAQFLCVSAESCLREIRASERFQSRLLVFRGTQLKIHKWYLWQLKNSLGKI